MAAADATQVVADLQAAADRVAEAEAAIDEYGEASVEAAADAYRQAIRLFDSYEDRATGTGDFTGYLQFENEFLALVESLPDDILAAEAFERVSDRLDKRRLSESDFNYAREQIEDAHEAIELLEERDEAKQAYRQARQAAKQQRKTLQAEADRLRELQRLADVDLDRSLEPLSGRVSAYNDAVSDAFEQVRRQRAARELFDLLAAAADRPLIDVRRPPSELVDYIDSSPAGTEPLATLLEYADYSPSKLEHYVEDPGALRTNVSVHRTYLDRLDSEPLHVGWPPAEAATLRARLDELRPITRRLDRVFTEPLEAGETEDTAADRPGGTNRIEIARRRLWRFSRTAEYDELREIAQAKSRLDDEEFERVASGAVADDLAAVTDAISEIDTALEATAIA